MNIRTQIFIIFVVLVFMFFLANLVRRNKVELKYVLLWLLLGAGILIFACFPHLCTALAVLLGIGQPINLLFFIGFCFTLMIIFSQSVSLSRLSEKNKKLTQELGLLRDEVNRISQWEKALPGDCGEQSAGKV